MGCMLGLLIGIFLFGQANACVFKYGSEPEGLEHTAHAGTPWDYDFAGLDWAGVDGSGNAWQCHAGSQQSPINVPSIQGLDLIPAAARAELSLGVLLSNGSNVEVINNGHTVQVESTAWRAIANITVALPLNAGAVNGSAPRGPLLRALEAAGAPAGARFARVSLTPVQFHFHTHSEHSVNGMHSALELHIVTRTTSLAGCPATGCFAVFGVMLQVDPDSREDHPLIDAIWEVMPFKQDNTRTVPAGVRLDFDSLLPPPGARTYTTYAGSLTTPPCSEGILWHVFTGARTITLAQMEDFLLATGDYACQAMQDTSTTAPTDTTGNATAPAAAADSASGRRLRSEAQGGTGQPQASAAVAAAAAAKAAVAAASNQAVASCRAASSIAAVAQQAGVQWSRVLPVASASAGEEQHHRLLAGTTAATPSTTSNTTAAADGANAWLDHGDHVHTGDLSFQLHTNDTGTYMCTKMGAGQNYRMVQPLLGRRVAVALDTADTPQPPPPPPPRASPPAAAAPTTSDAPQHMRRSALAIAIIGGAVGGAVLAVAVYAGVAARRAAAAGAQGKVGAAAEPASAAAGAPGLGTGPQLPPPPRYSEVDEERQQLMPGTAFAQSAPLRV